MQVQRESLWTQATCEYSIVTRIDLIVELDIHPEAVDIVVPGRCLKGEIVLDTLRVDTSEPTGKCAIISDETSLDGSKAYAQKKLWWPPLLGIFFKISVEYGASAGRISTHRRSTGLDGSLRIRIQTASR